MHVYVRGVHLCKRDGNVSTVLTKQRPSELSVLLLSFGRQLAAAPHRAASLYWREVRPENEEKCSSEGLLSLETLNISDTRMGKQESRV